MKTVVLLAIAFISWNSFAQSLPRKSSKSEIEQVVGLNEIELEYSRPNVNGREIFGDLVPYGEVWRLGANAPTIIDIEYPIYINEQKLDTGEYAIFAIPSKNAWKFVFNTDTKQWGAYDYDEKKNVLEYTAPVGSCDFTETFTMEFSNVEESSAVISMRWATTEVKVPFTTNTTEVVEKNINAAVAKGEDLAKVYYRAADYYFEHDNMETTLVYLNKSIEIEKTYYNLFLQAQIEHKEERLDAKKTGEAAAKLAEKAEKQGWADYIREEIANW